MADVPDLSIIVFAYNEAQNGAPVLSELRQWLQAHESRAEIVFVDDGSSDGGGGGVGRIRVHGTVNCSFSSGAFSPASGQTNCP